MNPPAARALIGMARLAGAAPWRDGGLDEAGVPADEARRVADEVLARPEFRRPAPTLVERAQRWLAEALGRIFERLVGGGAPTLVGWLVLGGFVAGIVLVVVRFGRSVSVEARGPGVVVDVARPRTSAEWLAEAAEHEEAGRPRLAIRCRYHALVTDLDERGLLDETPARTTGEERAVLSRAVPGLAGPFAAATEVFDAVWYGGAPASTSDLTAFRAHAEAVVAAASHRRAPTGAAAR